MIVKLKVPSPWNINGFVDGDGIPGGDFVCYPSYPERWMHVKMGWMKRTLHVPEDWGGKTILLHFEAVCGHCQVYIDGKKVGEHFDISLPQTYLVNPFVTPGKDHELWVGVRAPELFNVNNDSTKFTYPTGSFFNHEYYRNLAGCVFAGCSGRAHQGCICATGFVSRSLKGSGDH